MSKVDFSSLAPCPFCGSTNLRFTASRHSGHGDSGYQDARIICNNCPATEGYYDYGDTDDSTVMLAAKAWNKRLDDDIPVKLIEEEPKEDDDLYRLYKKWGSHYSLHDWLTKLTLKTNK